MNYNKNTVTDEKYLPPIPKKVKDVENFFQLLTDRTQNDWKFLFEEIKNIPNAFEGNQDYDFNMIDEKKWQDIVVPSSLLMQGFNIENNVEYYCKRTVTIPKDYANKRVFLRFEGVYSNARVWVNNKYCACHTGGFTAWDVDISDFSKLGEITLTIGVADLEGKKKSVWNTDGKYQSNSAWASYYAHHNIGGIIRDITMFCLPKQSVLQTNIDTVIGKSKSTAKIDMTLFDECIGLTLQAEIIKDGETKASKTIQINSCKTSFELDVFSAELWDAEHPNLYTLETTLLDGNKTVLQKNSVKFGFREIVYGGKNGTDKNKIYINKREVKLRGVCRHDVSRLYGRSVTKEDIYQEIKTYKEHNINHIRTSHYPASDFLLDVCDELGMYVEQENSACFKGANGFYIYNPPQDFLNSFKEMVTYSRNHPSVIIWSIANESNFEKSSGFRDCYNYIKETETTRPVIFSYPYTVKSKPLPFDIYSKHYAKVTSKLGKSDMPILHDEFAHIPCYNINDLKYDNSCRVFWGESIKRGWDNIFDTNGALGCDIWAAIDDVFYLPESNMEKHQNHLKGASAGYGEWGCIFDAFKRLKPEAFLTKKAFSPIKINLTNIGENKIAFDLQNRFDHTNLDEVQVTVFDKDSNIIYCDKIKESIEPHKKGTVLISPLKTTDDMKVEFSVNGIVAETSRLKKTTPKISISAQTPNVEYGENFIRISTYKDTVAVIDGMHLYTGLVKFEVEHRDIFRVKDNTYKADFGFGRIFLLTVYEEAGRLRIEVKPFNKFTSLYATGEIGVDIKLTDDVYSVSWERNALYNDYPEDHIARSFGTAYKKGAVHNYSDTDMSKVSWEADMSAFAYYDKNSDCNTLASNDFKTKRLKINNYLVNTVHGTKVLVKTDSKNINTYANPFNSKLQISKGDYKRSVLWGNYWGKRFSLNNKNIFEFFLYFEE